MEYNWKKHAAQVVDDDQTEKAFFDQAYGFIANKAGPLMQGPYRLGFETVYKNDENTRMVGIFAFRIGDDLLYAPVFFLNGEIKGTDLLYRHSTKTFVPLNHGWANMLIEQSSVSDGRGINRGESRKSPTDLEFHRLSAPPGHGGFKSGSVEKSASVVWTDEILPELEQRPEFQPLLRNLLLDEECGWDAFTKLAAEIKTNLDFARNLYDTLPESVWMPEELKAPEVKTASKKSATELGQLILHLGEFPPSHLMSKSASFYKQGYASEDYRPAGDLTPVYEDASQEITNVSEPGVYKVLMQNGDLLKAFCAPVDSCTLTDSSKSTIPETPSRRYSSYTEQQNDRVSPTEHCVILLDNNKETTCAYNVMGCPESSVTEYKADAAQNKLGSLECCEDAMTQGKGYRVFSHKTGTLSKDSIYCLGKTSRDGIVEYQVVSDRRFGGPTSLMHNPDSPTTDVSKGVLGEGVSFIEVGVDTFERHENGPRVEYTFEAKDDIRLGDESAIYDWVVRIGTKKASIIFKDGEYMVRTGPLKNTTWMPKVACFVFLARDLSIKDTTAEDLMEKAAKAGSQGYNFFLVPPETTEKRAAVIRVVDEPSFDYNSDNTFGVAMERMSQPFVLATQTETDRPPDHRIGDGYRSSRTQGANQDSTNESGIPKDFLLHSNPDQLGQIAKQLGVPQVFDHGAVGALVDTFDSIAMVDRYIPKLEDALDSLGRLLFLFYWKPGDFQNAYGVDDMINLENQLLSTFKQFGGQILNLIKKSRSQARDTKYRSE